MLYVVQAPYGPDLHDYDPAKTGAVADGDILQFNTSVDWTIDGLVPAAAGAHVLFWNASAGTVSVISGSTNSDDVNRFAASQGATVVLQPGMFAEFVRILDRWRGPV